MSARMSRWMHELEQSTRQVAAFQRRREEAFVSMKERDERISLLEQEIGAL